ncbi:MAG: hypothetical protein Kow0077_25770 [Anaerolineae bacterium]
MNPLRRVLNFGSWSVRAKLVFGLGLVIIVPLVMVFFSWLQSAGDAALESYETNLENAALAAAAGVSANLEDVLTEVLNTSLDQRLYGQMAVFSRVARDVTGPVSGTTRVNTINTLTTVLERHPNFEAIRMLTPEGFMMIVVGNTEDYPSLNDVFQESRPVTRQMRAMTLADGEVRLLDPYLDYYSDSLVLDAVTPIMDDDELLGYLVFTLNPRTILQAPLLANMGEAGEGFSSQYLYLLDENGWLLTPVKGFAPLERQFTLRSAPARPDDATPAEGAGRYLQDFGDELERVMGRHAYVQPYDWAVVAEVAIEDVLTPVVQQTIRRIAPVGAVAVLFGLILIAVLNAQLVTPLVQLTRVADTVAGGNLNVRVPSTYRMDEIGQLYRSIATMTDNLRQSIESLEQRVQERTRDLRTTTAIAMEASQVEDLNTLLNSAVNLIVENFPVVYHAQVFLVDERREYANLVASTGEAGRQLLARGHRLAVGSVSVIGRVTELGETVIARDTSTSRVHRWNEFLPNTRAEMAIPLIRGGRILGALDIQSTQPAAFRPEEQEVFETLAAELAILIDNALRFEQLNDRMRELEIQSQALTRAEWGQLLTSGRRRGYLEAAASREAVTVEERGWSAWQRRAAETQDVVISPEQEDGTVFLAVPVLNPTGQVLGVVEWQVEAWRINEQTLQMAGQLTRRLSTSMETVRLLERTQLLAERERLVNRIGGKLTAEPNVAYILETAIEELSSALATSRVSVQLHTAADGNGATESA